MSKVMNNKHDTIEELMGVLYEYTKDISKSKLKFIALCHIKFNPKSNARFLLTNKDDNTKMRIISNGKCITVIITKDNEIIDMHSCDTNITVSKLLYDLYDYKSMKGE